MSSEVTVRPKLPHDRVNELFHNGFKARIFEQSIGNEQQLHLTIEGLESTYIVTLEEQNRGWSADNKTSISIDKTIIQPEDYQKIGYHINTRPDISSPHYVKVIQRTDGTILSTVGDLKSVGPDAIDSIRTVRGILIRDKIRYMDNIMALHDLLSEINASQQ